MNENESVEIEEKDVLDDVEVISKGSEIIVHNVITKEHVSIQEDLISRVRGLLSMDRKIRKYSVSSEYGTDWERLELSIGKYKLELSLSKSSDS